MYVILHLKRPADYVTADMDVLTGIGTGSPFDKRNLSPIHFYAGYGIGVDAGTGVAVPPAWAARGGRSRSVCARDGSAAADGALRMQGGPVGVTGHQAGRVCLTPGAKPLLDFLSFVVVPCSACGVFET